jgi:hypothetical protein
MAFRPERCAPIGRSSRIAPRAELSFCSVPTQPHGYGSMLDEAGGEEVVVNAVWYLQMCLGQRANKSCDQS